MGRFLLLVMYSVHELRRSSSLVTPSAVALGESHTPTLYDPGGVASVVGLSCGWLSWLSHRMKAAIFSGFSDAELPSGLS